MSAYFAVLKLAPIRRMLLAAFLSRVPMGILGLATVLFLHQEGRSYGVAGLVGGMLGFGLASSAVLQARVVNRRGRTSLAIVAPVFVLVAIGLLVGGTQGWPAFVLAPLGLGVGALLPASSSIVRGQYSAAINSSPELERSVFALDSALTESTYISGPALVALSVAVASAAVAIGAAVVAAVCSVAALLRTHAEVVVPDRPEASRGRFRYPRAVVALIVATFPVGFGFGVDDVAYPAYATAHHHAAVSGILLALAALVAVCSGLAYGLASERVPTTTVLFVGAFLYPVAFALPALGSSFVTMCFLVLPVGLATGWWVTARNHVVSVASPMDLRTSANGWVLLSVYLGQAVGLIVGGAIVDAAGWRIAILVGGSVVAGTTVVTMLARAALLDEAHGISAVGPKAVTLG